MNGIRMVVDIMTVDTRKTILGTSDCCKCVCVCVCVCAWLRNSF
jgi:hypothetical protein